MKNKLRYGDAIIPYRVIQTKRKKTIQIFVEKDDVEVRAPESINPSEISIEELENFKWMTLGQLYSFHNIENSIEILKE